MGLSSTAEGVETAETLDALRKLGVTSAQGYHISRPLGLDALLTWLRQSGNRDRFEVAAS